MGKTVWVLSEERPKAKVLEFVFEKFCEFEGLRPSISDVRISPVVTGDGRFAFWYDVEGLSARGVANVRLAIVSGTSSFVDFLIFYQEDEPREGDRPMFLVEETKTDDSESRNTGVFQRASKFVYAAMHYPGIKQVMYYNLRVVQNHHQTATNVFGTRCLRTLGVEIEGKVNDLALNEPFADLDELITARAAIRRPPAGNVPILVTRVADGLRVTGRLYKSGGLSHDPNIGAISLIAATIRNLGFSGDIVIAEHGLSQSHVNRRNKFVRIANRLALRLEGLSLPESDLEYPYWRYDRTSEKNASILLHVLAENGSGIRSVFENHAGSEKGYFLTGDDVPLALMKYVPGVLPRKSLDIPDLILCDDDANQIVNIEGKTARNTQLGLDTLENYDDIERLYIGEHYPDHAVLRSLVLFGGDDDSVVEHPSIGLHLTSTGRVHVGRGAPAVYRAVTSVFHP